MGHLQYPTLSYAGATWPVLNTLTAFNPSWDDLSHHQPNPLLGPVPQPVLWQLIQVSQLQALCNDTNPVPFWCHHVLHETSALSCSLKVGCSAVWPGSLPWWLSSCFLCKFIILRLYYMDIKVLSRQRFGRESPARKLFHHLLVCLFLHLLDNSFGILYTRQQQIQL